MKVIMKFPVILFKGEGVVQYSSCWRCCWCWLVSCSMWDVCSCMSSVWTRFTTSSLNCCWVLSSLNTEHFTNETQQKVHQSGIKSHFSRKNECVTSLQLPVSLGPAPGSSPSSWCRAQSWLPSPSPHSASAPDSSSPEPAVTTGGWLV